MPVYEYECQSCKKRFERKQSFHDEPIKVCPDCSGPTKRLLQAPPIIFKGSGWYITDSRGNSESATVGGAGSTTESKSENKAESKSETKSDSKPASTDSSSSSSGGTSSNKSE